MKKLLILAAIILSFSSFSYAIEVNQRILTAFKFDFSTATNVEWKLLDGSSLYEAVFIYNGDRLNAFYNEDGELVSTARYIQPSVLPMLASKAIQEKYAAYLVRTIIECHHDNQTSYYITLVSQKKSLIVAATPQGQLSVFKKFKTY